LAITVAAREKQQVSATCLWLVRTIIRASASISCFMRQLLNIMGVSKGIELRFTVSLFGFYAPATG
jgi:hypothetical protein